MEQEGAILSIWTRCLDSSGRESVHRESRTTAINMKDNWEVAFTKRCSCWWKKGSFNCAGLFLLYFCGKIILTSLLSYFSPKSSLKGGSQRFHVTPANNTTLSSSIELPFTIQPLSWNLSFQQPQNTFSSFTIIYYNSAADIGNMAWKHKGSILNWLK